MNEEMLQKCPKLKRVTPKDNLIKNLRKRGVTVLDESKAAPTVTAHPDDFVHYCEPRILTVRESARIQSFPDSFQFKGKYTTGGQLRKIEVPRCTQVGNAVPPLFAEQIGNALMEMMKNGITESENLQFRVSTALKSIIGKDLINDKYIAVFELVKNAYDAGAKRVDIIFENVNTLNSKLIIKDDGKGMDLPDIRVNGFLLPIQKKRKKIEKRF